MKMPWSYRFLFPILVLALLILVVPTYGAQPERQTEFRSSTVPDEVCLTWSGDTTTTQTVQWRAALSVKKGLVQFRKKSEPEDAMKKVHADRLTLDDPLITNDPKVNRFTAVIKDLEPATKYTYRVGNGKDDGWSEWFEFRTAPAGPVPFSFLYMGDAQVGFGDWGKFLSSMYERFPQAAFCVMAGDLSNRGGERDNWDALFHAAEPVWSRIPVVPTIGNHEYMRGMIPQLYLDHFDLPRNGPETVPPEHAYSLKYANALFVILDANRPPATQREWLESQLAGSDATWKFAVYHQPAYSSTPKRDNPKIREQWSDLFERYHVDMVFQGHDHAYLRTYPMKNGQIMKSPDEGVIYVVACSGSKFYDQESHDYTAAGFEKTATCQVIDIQTEGGDKLTYRAYDSDGNVRDEVVIDKTKK